MSLDHGTRCLCGEELATPPPADEGETAGEAAPDPSLPTTWMEGSGPVSRSPGRAGGRVASLGLATGAKRRLTFRPGRSGARGRK